MDHRLPTLSDVARKAGVSYATADRVVNDRGGVSEKAARRVRAAVEMLGYIRNVAAANLSQRRTYRFVFLIPEGTNAFFAAIREHLAAERERMLRHSVDMVVQAVGAFDAVSLSERLGALEGQEVDGVALVGIDDARVTAKIDRLRARGVAVVTLVSDMSGTDRDGYIGPDNIAAGRTAGRLVGLAHGGRNGRVLPVVGALTARDHADRLSGFRQTIAADYPGIVIEAAIEGRDLSERVEAGVAAALATHADISAIYSIGAGNSGLIRVLEKLNSTHRPVVVMHELVPHARKALADGLVDIVLDQRPAEEIAQAISLMRLIADRLPAPQPSPVIPAIYLKENLPPATGVDITGETSR